MRLVKYFVALLFILAIVLSLSCQQKLISPTAPFFVYAKTVSPIPIVTNLQTSTPSATSTGVLLPDKTTQPLRISYIDVGQADCTIIQHGTNAMIIDAGGNATAASLVTIIRKLGISNFDIVVGTHPHEDHIGGLDAVINNFNIGSIFMPKVSNTTKTFEDVLTAIQNKELKISTPVPGDTFNLGQNVLCTILAPNNSSYSDLNNFSIVIKLVYDNRSFLFTGDAEAESEKEIISKGLDLKSNVLKVGHHGSTSSTSPEFLKTVSPAYAVIFVGNDNTYGHPHQATLDMLNTAGVKIYRTDLNGTITMTLVAGSVISMSTEK